MRIAEMLIFYFSQEREDLEKKQREMGEVGKAMGLLISGSLVYYHCAFRNASILSLFSDVIIVLLCSLAILGLLFRQLNISYASSSLSLS